MGNTVEKIEMIGNLRETPTIELTKRLNNIERARSRPDGLGSFVIPSICPKSTLRMNSSAYCHAASVLAMRLDGIHGCNRSCITSMSVFLGSWESSQHIAPPKPLFFT